MGVDAEGEMSDCKHRWEEGTNKDRPWPMRWKKKNTHRAEPQPQNCVAFMR